MSQIMKAFTGLFMVLFMMVTTTGLLGAFFQVLHAQNMHAAMVDEMENSNYSPVVVKECFEAAEEAGYDLEITLYSDNNPLIKVLNIANLPEKLEEISMAEVLLKYPFQIVFFGIDMQQEVFGYAR